ncbi:MAG: EF-hand domain-containing protein [Cyclobacteriaceae bacterium]
MISDYQKRKLTHLFTLLDINKNGYLQLGDFMSIADTLRKKMQLSEHSSHYQALCDSCKRLYDKFKEEICQPTKKTISLEEWINYFTDVLDSDRREEIVETYKVLIYSFLFDVFDDNNDGYISKEEYGEMYEIYNIDDAGIEEAFKSIDLYVDGRLSKYELINAIEVFLTSDEPKDRGNLIFGHLS